MTNLPINKKTSFYIYEFKPSGSAKKIPRFWGKNRIKKCNREIENDAEFFNGVQ